MSQSHHNETEPKVKLLRRLVIWREWERLASEPLQPISARGKARLIETFRKYGITDTRAVEDLPVAWESEIEALLNGTVKAIEIAAAYARQCLQMILNPQPFDAPHAGVVTRATTQGNDARGATTGASSAAEQGWYLKRINTDKKLPSAQLVFDTDEAQPVPRRVRIVGWTQEAVERVRNAVEDIALDTNDVYVLFDGSVSKEDNTTLMIDPPPGFRIVPIQTPVRLTVDERGTSQIVLAVRNARDEQVRG
ncbi:MAG: hypothetical protein ING77_14585 [Rhodocyclaceae bacterium]|nr:hypothetical protein [Rhodocyclaceae bacterium]MCA3502515.1 hypothetical protein [Rhodobacter sp.]